MSRWHTDPAFRRHMFARVARYDSKPVRVCSRYSCESIARYVVGLEHLCTRCGMAQIRVNCL